MSFSMIKEGDGPTQPPGDKIFSVEELAKYDGTLEELPIYLAVKGTGKIDKSCG